MVYVKRLVVFLMLQIVNYGIVVNLIEMIIFLVYHIIVFDNDMPGVTRADRFRGRYHGYQYDYYGATF
eukprot:UN05069